MGRLAAGSLTEHIELLIPVVNAPVVPDGQGGHLASPKPEPLLVWARKREISGTEALRLGQTLSSSVIEFTTRYRPSVTPKASLVWQGKTFGISRVTHDDLKEFTVLTCVDNGRG